MAVSDEELMWRAASDDLSAFGQLFDRWQPPLFAFLCRIVGDAATAEDVLQEVFLRVWEHRASFNGSKFSHWVYTIARYAALDEFKKSYRHAVRFSELAEMERRQVEAEQAGKPDDVAGEVALRLQVQEALQMLPPDQRVAIVLREYEGKSHKDIGEVLGCSEANARLLTYRARKTLRRLLKPLIENEVSVK